MFESDYYRLSKKGMLPVRWMAPESCSDGIYSPMSDIWSYGVLLYEMITFGSFPYQGLSNSQVLSHVKAGNTLSVPHGIKHQLGLVLRTCWSHTPTKRPTAGEIVELFYNNPRIVSPSIDVPLASIQAERSDSIELLPKIKNNQTGLKINLKNSQESLIEGRSDIILQGGDEEEWSTFLGPYNSGANMPGYVVLDHTATSL